MKHSIKLAALALLAGSGIGVIGCSSDDNKDNPQPIDTTGGSANGGGGTANGGSGTGGKGGTTGGNGGGGTANGGGGTANGGSGGADVDGGTGGLGAGGGEHIEAGTCVLGTQDPPCYTCEHGTPSKDTEFLNQCTANSCVKFDNSVLPNPLPAIP